MLGYVVKLEGVKVGKVWRVQVVVVRKGFWWGWAWVCVGGAGAGEGCADEFCDAVFEVDRASRGAALNVSARVEFGRLISVAMPRVSWWGVV